MPCGRFGGGMCPFCPPLGPALLLINEHKIVLHLPSAAEDSADVK